MVDFDPMDDQTLDDENPEAPAAADGMSDDMGDDMDLAADDADEEEDETAF